VVGLTDGQVSNILKSNFSSFAKTREDLLAKGFTVPQIMAKKQGDGILKRKRSPQWAR